MSRDGSSYGALDYSNRNYGPNGSYSNSLRGSPRRNNRIQSRDKEPTRGTFDFISVSDNGQHLVALETGWKTDMKKLADGLAGYADFSKVGVDDMEVNNIYACKDGDIWKRCRMVSRYGPGGFVVELIDHGGTMTVSRNQVLPLSQLYKDWGIKSMDVSFSDYVIEESSPANANELRDTLLNGSFQLAYTLERTPPQKRDRILITEMKQQDKNLLDVLVEKGILKKQVQQRQSPQRFDRPRSQQTTRSPRQDRPPLKPQRPITKTGSGPRFDMRPRQYDNSTTTQQSYGSTYQQHSSMENGWGTADPRNEGPGTDQWATQITDGCGSRGGKSSDQWNDQRENQDPQTSWSNTKQWPPSDWDDDANISQNATAGQPTTGSGSRNQSYSRKSTDSNSNNDNTRSKSASSWVCEWDVEPTPPPAEPTTSGSPQSSGGRALRGNSGESPKQSSPYQKKSSTEQTTNDDVFSSAGDWSDPSTNISTKSNELHKQVENLDLNADNSSPKECTRCIQLTNRVNSLEQTLFSPALQKIISSRLTNISTELRQVKMNLAQLRLDPATPESEAAREALAHWRREGRVRVKEVEELLLTASAETLASFGMNGWSQFVGVVWQPMMDLQYLDERPLCVYKGTVVRRVVVEDDTVLEVVDLSQKATKDSPERVTAVLERAIEIPRMFPVLQDLAPNRAQGRVHSVFFSEDNSKVFMQLEYPPSAEEDLEQFAKSTIDLLTDLHIID